MSTIRFIKDFQRNDQGVIAILFALFLGIFVPLLALPLDIGTAYMRSAALANATDSGAIGGAIESGDEAEVLEYFAANLPVGMYSIIYETDDIQIDVTNNAVLVTPHDVISSTYFLSGVSNSFVLVSTLSEVSLPSSNSGPADFYLSLDESGSMSGATLSPLTGLQVPKNIALRHSVEIMIDDIFDSQQAIDDFRLGMSSFNHNPTDITDPTNDAAALLGVLPAHTQASGATCGSCSMVKLYKMWQDEGLPFPPTRAVVVLMTDGYYNTPTTEVIDNPSDPYLSTSNATLQVKHLCDQFKNDIPGIDIWTIGLGYSVSTDALTYCASNPDQFILAANGIELGEAFQSVVTQTTNIRITK